MTQLLILFTLGETLLYRINSFQITVCRETGEKSSSNIEFEKILRCTVHTYSVTKFSGPFFNSIGNTP